MRIALCSVTAGRGLPCPHRAGAGVTNQPAPVVPAARSQNSTLRFTKTIRRSGMDKGAPTIMHQTTPKPKWKPGKARGPEAKLFSPHNPALHRRADGPALILARPATRRSPEPILGRPPSSRRTPSPRRTGKSSGSERRPPHSSGGSSATGPRSRRTRRGARPLFSFCFGAVPPAAGRRARAVR